MMRLRKLHAVGGNLGLSARMWRHLKSGKKTSLPLGASVIWWETDLDVSWKYFFRTASVNASAKPFRLFATGCTLNIFRCANCVHHPVRNDKVGYKIERVQIPRSQIPIPICVLTGCAPCCCVERSVHVGVGWMLKRMIVS